MTTTYIENSYVTWTSASGSQTVPALSSVQNDDTLIFYATAYPAITITYPTGFTTINGTTGTGTHTSARGYFARKLAASESGSYSFSSGATVCSGIAGILVIRSSVDKYGPWDTLESYNTSGSTQYANWLATGVDITTSGTSLKGMYPSANNTAHEMIDINFCWANRTVGSNPVATITTKTRFTKAFDITHSYASPGEMRMTFWYDMRDETWAQLEMRSHKLTWDASGQGFDGAIYFAGAANWQYSYEVPSAAGGNDSWL